MSFIRRIKNFLINSYKEVKYNTTWPSINELQTTCVVVFVFILIMCALIFGFDFIVMYVSNYLYN